MSYTETMPGRHFPLFEKMHRFLEKEGHKSDITALLVGAGHELVGESEIGTYQPFELANVIERAGIETYRIDVVDKREEALSCFVGSNNPRNIFRIFNRTHAEQYLLINIYYANKLFNSIYKTKMDMRDYFDNFFSERQERLNDNTMRIHVDNNLRSHFSPYQRDIFSQKLPGKDYDIVVCTAVIVWSLGQDRHLIYSKLKDAVRQGGLLMTEINGISDDPDFREIYSFSNEVMLSQKITGQ